MNIKNLRERRVAEKIDVEEGSYTDKYDLYKDIIKVHSKNILDGITEDIVLAKFEEPKDKIYLTEITHCEQQCRNIIDKIRRNHARNRAEHQNGTIIPLTDKEKQELNKIKDEVSKIFLAKASMLSLVNRNTNNNYLIKSLTNNKELEEETPETLGMSEAMKKVASRATENQEHRQ